MHSSTLSTAGSQDGHPQAGTQCHLHRGHGQGHHGGPLRGGDQAGRMVQKFVNNMCLSMVVVTPLQCILGLFKCQSYSSRISCSWHDLFKLKFSFRNISFGNISF